MVKTKIVPYGTTERVRVENASPKAIIAWGLDNKEGYVIMYHNIKDLPKRGDTGKVVFERNNGPTKGHWQFYPDAK